MRTAVNQFMAPALTLDEVAATARELGVEGVGVFRPCLAELGATAVARILSRHGLAATSVCVLLGLTGASASERQARLDDARNAVRDSGALGAPLVVIAGGPSGRRPAARVLDEFEDQLAVVAAEADRHGVRLLLEPLHPALLHLSVLTSLREACRIAEQHDIGVVLDTWHVGIEPDLLETAGKHAERIDVVHLAGWRPGPYTDRRALPGDGLLDHTDLREVLAEAWWELEVIDEDVAGPRAQRQLLRDAVGSARHCGLL